MNSENKAVVSRRGRADSGNVRETLRRGRMGMVRTQRLLPDRKRYLLNIARLRTFVKWEMICSTNMPAAYTYKIAIAVNKRAVQQSYYKRSDMTLKQWLLGCLAGR